MKHLSTSIRVLFATLLIVFSAGQASAEFKETYTSEAFNTAQNAGKHIIVEVFKQGCGTCKAQQPALKQAKQDHPGAVFLAVDFASNTTAVQKFKVVKQSTIIVFKDGKEVARLVGETAKDKILDAIAKGV